MPVKPKTNRTYKKYSKNEVYCRHKKNKGRLSKDKDIYIDKYKIK